ncbi:SWR1 complex protein [Mycena amicta]|nr:SWR1 complex protein [Mycena amicta]
MLSNGPGRLTRSNRRSNAGDVAPPEKGKGKGKAKTTDSSPVASTSQADEGRLALLSEKKAQLAAVIDRHDDLVREQFHLENFKMMVDYDPKVAKQNQSQVFQNYKSQYDLADAAVSVVSSSPRKTRSAHAGLLKLVNPPVAGPSRLPAAHEKPPAPVKSPKRIIVKRVAPLPLPPPPPPPKTVSARAKGKEKAVPPAKAYSISVSAGRARTRSQSTEQSISARQLRKRGVDPSDAQPSHADPPPRKKRKLDGSSSAVVPRDAVSRHSALTTSISAPVNGRALRQRVFAAPPPNPPPPLAIIKIKRQRAPVTPPPVPPDADAAAFFLSPSGIKRVRLIVRRPPPRFLSHHRQRPPKPQFDSSLPAFLSSYVDVDDQTYTIDPATGLNEEVLRLANTQAVVWERVAAMKRAGRWFGSDLLDSFRAGDSHSGSATPFDPNASAGELMASGIHAEPADTWAAVVQAVTERGRKKHVSGSPKAKKTRGQLVAGQVAARIQGYWDAEAAKQEKERLLEERRMRGVAKSVAKLVVAEWKKAVFHIREQERLKVEAEELKRGHEHLDAILDQSGHILVTQQGDLTRGVGSRSRSASVSARGHWQEEESDADEDEEGELDEDETKVSEGIETEPDDGISVAADEADEEDISSSALLIRAQSTPDDEEASASVEDTKLPSVAPQAQDADLISPITEDDFILPNPEVDPVESDKGSSRSNSTPPHDQIATVEELAPGADGDAVMDDGDSRADDEKKDTRPPEPEIPAYLRPYAVAPVEWDPTKRVVPPLLLRGNLRPYQYSGLEWLASLHQNNLNGILADEMGLGKTIQTISLLAHLACDRGIWGPHLIVVPTSVLLNWEMEFKKFLPGFRVLSYHGNAKHRKELRQGWNDKHQFNVCITSYTLASKDAMVFKRKPWYYFILDEAHMIKNFKSQRWTTLLMFRSFRRLLLTGTPLQNNLTELWSLLQFLMSGSDFVNLKEFGDWFSNPLEKAIEAGNIRDEDTLQRVTKLHTVLRPYLLRRLKRDVEKELPSKYEHLVLCPLSKRQRFLYDEFMSRAHTRDALQSGVYQKIANILMQLRKVCNHPDLFEVRPIVTSFAMQRSAVADFEIKELLVRRRLLSQCDDDSVDLDLFGFRFIDRQGSSLIAARETRRLDATARLPFISEIPGAPPPKDTRTIAGYRAYSTYQKRAETISRWAYVGYINKLRCSSSPIYGSETLDVVHQLGAQPLVPLSHCDTATNYLDTVYRVNAAIKSYSNRAQDMSGVIDRFAFCTPAVVALDLPHIALAGSAFHFPTLSPSFDAVLHRVSVKLQIAFPDPSLLQYDCGKLQRLAELLREKKVGRHRVLIFTQMTRILDILEMFLSFHGYLYLRLDGATRIEDRQYITERFNADSRVFCFIASSRSGGVGINLTGADTVVFYDSDFNPQMDRQCEDRAHRIGQIRDVHIYRFVSAHTVEEAMLRKANQKRSLDDLVIQKGEFDWRSLFAFDDDAAGDSVLGGGIPDAALTRALAEFDDRDDAYAAVVAAREEVAREGQDEAEFLDDADGAVVAVPPIAEEVPTNQEQEEEEEEGGSVADYMITFVQRDMEYFKEWRV